MDNDDAALYELWREFFDQRRAHLGQRGVVSRDRMVDLAVQTVVCVQRAVRLDAWASALFADVDQVQQRIRARQQEPIGVSGGRPVARE